MFARCAFRAAQPLRMQARRYAAEARSAATGAGAGTGSSTTSKGSSSSGGGGSPTTSSGGSSSGGGGSKTALYLAGAAAAAAAAGGYWYLGGGGGAAQPAGAKQAGGGGGRAAFTGGDQGFVSLRLAEVETVNHNTKRLRFELPEADMVSGLRVASAVLARVPGGEGGKATVRPYTPVSDEDCRGHLDLLVKKYAGGAASTHLHAMTPGQRLDVKGPLPKYAWAPNRHEHVGLIAGGTGITPMYQLLRAILADPADRTRVTLVFGNVAEPDVLLRDELAALENAFPQRFRAFYVLDKPPREGWTGAAGFITADLLRSVLPEPGSGDVKLFVCGPPGLMSAVSGNKASPRDQGELAGALKELGYSKDQVYKF